MKKTHLVALILSFTLIAPVFALADQSTDALIAQLKAKIAELTAQLTALQNSQNEGQAWCHTFNTNLKIGDSGDEVFTLVQALQKEGLISYGIAGHPPATPQDAVFTENTASAVTGFQEKYREEILTPLGLKYGTGYVGKSTRAKLNRLYGCGGNTRIGSLYIKPANISLRVGETVQVQAMYQPPMPPCPEGMGCIQVMPAPRSVVAKWTSSNPSVASINTIVGDCFTPGCTPIYAFSVGGISSGVAVIKAIYNSPSGAILTATTNVTISNGVTTAPHINSISPQSGPVGTQVTLTGTGFLTSSNTIKLGNWYFKNLNSSGGTTLQFTVPSDINDYCSPLIPDCTQIAVLTPIIRGQYQLSVINANGTSNSVSFTVTFSSTQPSIQVLSPNGGEAWTIGSTQTIRWTLNPSISTLDISLKQWIAPCNGQFCTAQYPTSYQIARNISDNGSYFWAIPNCNANNPCSSNFQIPTGKYVIVLSTGSDPGFLFDESDAPFSIVSKP